MYCQAAVWQDTVMSSWLGGARKLAVYREMIVVVGAVGAHLVGVHRKQCLG